MKKHPRMLRLTTKLLMGHDMQSVGKLADDFAKYREGNSNLHPALKAAFSRFEDHFPVVFKYRRQLRTGIYDNALLSIIQNVKPKAHWQDYYYQRPPVMEEFHFTLVPEPSPKTLH